MKKAFISCLAVVAVGVLVAIAYWQFGYVKQLDWRTAYHYYTSWECSPCLSFYEKLNSEDIKDIEKDSGIGIMNYISQAHMTDGYSALSPEQLQENARTQKLLTLLKQKGANIDFVPPMSSAVLFGAVTSSDVSLVEFLLELGADPKVTNYVRGQPITCLELAQQNLQKAKQAEKTAMNQRLVESLTKIVGLLEQAQSQ